MCFRPPTIEMEGNNTCPQCGADLFIGAMKCKSCGASVGNAGPIGTKAAPPKGAPGSSDQTSFGGAKTGVLPSPPVPRSAPPIPKAPTPPAPK